MIDSGDPLVVMFNTNGLSVHKRCVGQYEQRLGPDKRKRGTRRDKVDKTSFPIKG